MSALLKTKRKYDILALMALIAAGLTFHTPAPSQELTYNSGQPVLPLYLGYMEKPDGFDMYFGYLNNNWQEEVDVPIGPDNNIAPAQPMGPDGGQPTHFLPRMNRWQFTVHVPADFGSKEIVWTVESHGSINRAYGVIRPGYILDDYVIQHDFGSDSTHDRKNPILQVEGAKERDVKVGEPVQLVAVATDPNPSRARGGRGGGRATAQQARSFGELSGAIGGDGIRSSPAGLRLAWYQYRGAGIVKFDPPQFKVWEDQRGGSPWAPGWQPPPIPSDNKWIIRATFPAAGTYVLRCLAHNGSKFVYESVVFNVSGSGNSASVGH